MERVKHSFKVPYSGFCLFLFNEWGRCVLSVSLRGLPHLLPGDPQPRCMPLLFTPVVTHTLQTWAWQMQRQGWPWMRDPSWRPGRWWRRAWHPGSGPPSRCRVRGLCRPARPGALRCLRVDLRMHRRTSRGEAMRWIEGAQASNPLHSPPCTQPPTCPLASRLLTRRLRRGRRRPATDPTWC